MGELHGVVAYSVDLDIEHELKRIALFFDQLYIPFVDAILAGKAAFCQTFKGKPLPEYEAYRFLRSRGFITDETQGCGNSLTLDDVSETYPLVLNNEIGYDLFYRKEASIFTRRLAENLASRGHEAVAVLGSAVKNEWGILEVPSDHALNGQMAPVLRVALRAIPTPDTSCSWQDILDFKCEMHDKLWHFRRFLHSLSIKKQSDAEIRDDIEWSLNEYTKAMDRFKIKRTISFMETYVVPTVEAFESLKPSAFLKGFVSIKKRKLELLEGEASAPGREVAYVFDVRKRFGDPS